MDEKKTRNWGKPFSIVSLVFGIIALVFGALALIPFLGLAFAIITATLGVIAAACGVPGIIGSATKSKAVVGIVFGGTMIIWGIIRYIWVIVAVAATVA